MFIYTFTLAYWMHVANLFCAISRERANRDLDTDGGKRLKMRAKIQRVGSFFFFFFHSFLSNTEKKKTHFLLIKFTLELYFMFAYTHNNIQVILESSNAKLMLISPIWWSSFFFCLPYEMNSNEWKKNCWINLSWIGKKQRQKMMIKIMNGGKNKR